MGAWHGHDHLTGQERALRADRPRGDLEPDDPLTGRLIAALSAVETVRLAASDTPMPESIDPVAASLWRKKAAVRLEARTVEQVRACSGCEFSCPVNGISWSGSRISAPVCRLPCGCGVRRPSARHLFGIERHWLVPAPPPRTANVSQATSLPG